MRLLMLICVLLLAGCSAKTEDYRGQQPVLDLREYFNGDLKAWGQFQDRSGKVIKRFTVDMKGTWTGNEGKLEEYFTYDDGTKQTRIWYLSALPDGRYTGRADDVIGIAEGQASGPALHWHYTLALPVDGKTYHVRFNDWMWLHDQHTMVNRAVMSKFGIRLGEVTLFFRKADASNENGEA
ncbi:MAG: DUF3833 domain-containing protein [Moraxellaceae bacterium]|nr:DUF3833 domain-containing protein [Moraxellaceae bacterium]